jgi:hypothetical protein
MAKKYKIVEIKKPKNIIRVKGLSKSEADDLFDSLTRLYPNVKLSLMKHDADDEEPEENYFDGLDDNVEYE